MMFFRLAILSMLLSLPIGCASLTRWDLDSGSKPQVELLGNWKQILDNTQPPHIWEFANDGNMRSSIDAKPANVEAYKLDGRILKIGGVEYLVELLDKKSLVISSKDERLHFERAQQIDSLRPPK